MRALLCRGGVRAHGRVVHGAAFQQSGRASGACRSGRQLRRTVAASACSRSTSAAASSAARCASAYAPNAASLLQAAQTARPCAGPGLGTQVAAQAVWRAAAGWSA